MLILIRDVGQSFRIGDDIKIKVIGAKENMARFKVDAPKTVRIKKKPQRKGTKD